MPEGEEPGARGADPAEEQPGVPTDGSQPASGDGANGATAEGQGTPPAVEAMRQVVFTGLVMELPSTHPTVILQEIDEPRRELQVTIGQTEGVAIAYAWRGLPAPRPLTHDLLTTVLQQFDVQIDVVRITRAEGAVFFAEVALSGPTGSRTVECRPSDALALVLRQPLPVPIMVAEDVLAAAGRIPGT